MRTGKLVRCSNRRRVYILDDFLIQVRYRTTLEWGFDHVARFLFVRLLENSLCGMDYVRGIVSGHVT